MGVTDRTKCLICETELPTEIASTDPIPRIYDVSCPRCGRYSMTSHSVLELSRFGQEDRSKLSCLLREREIHGLPRITLISEPLQDPPRTPAIALDEYIHQHWPKNVAQRINRATLNIGRLSKHLGQVIDFEPKDFPLLFALNAQEFHFMLKYHAENGLVEDIAVRRLTLTPAGWARVLELRELNRVHDATTAFVAMSFGPELSTIYTTAIAPAIEEAGYKAIRVDMKEFTGDIMDEIISEIRKARFVVADLTEQKNGVYFEAGFALGLDLPVVWTCREDEVANLHFDTRQYNYIVWKDAEALRQKLRHRIGAVIL
jgi:nucleoside 2-deoxyribosyltransferase